VRLPLRVLLCYAIVSIAAFANRRDSVDRDWPVYNGDTAQSHFSPLTQINRRTVRQLRVAWTFDTNEAGGLQTNPLVIGHTLYGFTPSQKVIALDAASGKLRWTFYAGIPGTQPARGLSYWSDGKHSMLFAGILNFLYALDPSTGKPITSFGDAGRIDLRKELGETSVEDAFVAMTSPGVIYRDEIIVGMRLPETKPALRGDIRAFDVHTGKLRWSFHTIPHPGEEGYETWPKDAWKNSGSANNWTGMALDEKRGIVYVPTGSAVDDFYGGDRVGDDLFADTLLALDANTGKRLWHFQGVHHDIWDRDFPSPPTLLTVTSGGRQVDAIAQTSKQGFVFLFDRVTGKPLFPIAEKPFGGSTLPGERASATQPIPVAPEPFARQRMTEDMVTRRTPEAHEAALQEFRSFRNGGPFTPFSLEQQTVVFPGFDGGAEWGGSAVDPHGIFYVNANDVPWTGGVTAKAESEMSLGAKAYASQCAICHGADRRGSPPEFPSLKGVSTRVSNEQIGTVIHAGKGRMPAFPGIRGETLASLIDYLRTVNADASSTKREAEPSTASSRSYQFTGYRRFVDRDGYPAVVPPWGTLNAINLNTGKYLWRVPLGNYPELAAKGMNDTGTENYGGPVVTAGGLVFIGATIYDHMLRALDSGTGELLWSADLPYAGVATPATYMIDGKQYVVIATSNARNPKAKQGAAYVAFALQ
jgi:quinoprotein glucose dehydrogenase